MTVVVEAVDGSFPDGPIHALDFAIGPGMLGLGQAVIDVVPSAGIFEGVCPEAFTISHSLFDLGDGRALSAWGGEAGAVVRENGMDLVGHGHDEMQREVGSGSGRCRLVQLGRSELGRLIVATRRCRFPCSMRTSAMSMWK